MIANYTNHAANERTFLAWIRTGLAVAAFGFFLIKLNVFLDAAGGGGIPHLAAEDAGAVVPVANRYAGLAMVAIGIAIVARSGFAFERTRRAIDRDEIVQIPQSRAESLLAAALAILHQSRADLTFAPRFHFETDRRTLRWIGKPKTGPAPLCVPLD